MKYYGSRLEEEATSRRGNYTRLSRAVCGKSKGLEAFYKDGLDIHISKLSEIVRATGKPVTHYVEFDDGELPIGFAIGNHNVVNSNLNGDAALRLSHLKEVSELKDRLLNEKDAVIEMKEEEIRRLKEEIAKLHIAISNERPDESRT